jgi:hypothetical protein
MGTGTGCLDYGLFGHELLGLRVVRTRLYGLDGLNGTDCMG